MIALMIAAMALLTSPGLAVADVSSDQAVGFLNQQRAGNGLPGDLAVDGNLTYGCQQHNAYIAANGGTLVHGENPGNPGYTPAGAGVGQYAYRSEILSYSAYDSAGANPWEMAPIHLYLMLDPERTTAGYDNSFDSVCMRLGGSRTVGVPTFYSYPGPGASGMYPAEEASELPYTPQELVGIPEAATTGPNILLFSLGAGTDLMADSYSLTGPTGPVPSKLVVESTQNEVGSGFWFAGGGVLIPGNRLNPFTTYEVVIAWRNSANQTFTQQFSFTTGADNLPRERIRPHLALKRGRLRGGRVNVRVKADRVLRARRAFISISRQRRKCGSDIGPTGQPVRFCTWVKARKERKRRLVLQAWTKIRVPMPKRRQRLVLRARTKPFKIEAQPYAAARDRLTLR